MVDVVRGGGGSVMKSSVMTMQGEIKKKSDCGNGGRAEVTVVEMVREWW